MKKLPALFCALMLAIAAPAWAAMDRDGAAAAAQQASGGRVLSVDRADHEGRPMWRVKVVTREGVVKVILIDAATGRVQ